MRCGSGIPGQNVEAALGAWPYRVESVTPLPGGWNSATWLVRTAEGRYVAKLVDDADAAGLVSGLRIAEFLAARGLACGAPARTGDNELTIRLPEGTLALLRHEPGASPDLSVPGQARRAGRVLALAHQALRDYPVGSDPRYRWPWEWVAQCLDTIAIPEHVTAAARRIWPTIVRTVADHQLSISVIHADPGPAGLPPRRRWRTGRAHRLGNHAARAAAVRPGMLRGHHQAGLPGGGALVHRGVCRADAGDRPAARSFGCLVKARWLANAIYFSSRIERGIERGSGSPTANQDGLAAAYAGMTATD